MVTRTAHTPVLLDEVLELLDVREGGSYIDGTLGSAGHALAIIERAGRDGRLLGIDRDREAITRAGEVLDAHAERCTLVHGNHANVADIAGEHGFGKADGILFDLGVSSEQLDEPARGFSFSRPGPLDMRMDKRERVTAADLVADLDEEVLCRVLRENGDEPKAKRIARAIVRARERSALETTQDLSDVVAGAVGGKKGRLHPATRAFLALRIAVNRELSSLEAGLEAGLGILATGGRMAVISFHSQEDRVVKRRFSAHAGRWESLPAGGRVRQGEMPRVSLVNRKPVRPGEPEIKANPRARSAKLRVVERAE